MTHNCKAPYSICKHGLFYQAACKSGIGKEQAEELTEKLKTFHDHSLYRRKPVEQRISEIEEFLNILPPILANHALRIIYYFSSEGKYIGGFVKAVYELNPNAFKGETLSFKTKDWREGKLPWYEWDYSFGKREVYNEQTLKVDTYYLPEEEFNKIVDIQKRVATEYVEFQLKACRQNLIDKLDKAKEPFDILESEFQQIINVLEDKDSGAYSITYPGKKFFIFWPAQYGPFAKEGYLNEIAYWYNKLNRGSLEIWKHIKPNHIRKDFTTHCIAPAFAEAFWLFRLDLEELIQHYSPEEPKRDLGQQLLAVKVSPHKLREIQKVLFTYLIALKLTKGKGLKLLLKEIKSKIYTYTEEVQKILFPIIILQAEREEVDSEILKEWLNEKINVSHIKENKLSYRQIALLYRYLGEHISVGNMEEIAKDYGFIAATSGKKLYDTFNSLRQPIDRTGKHKNGMKDIKRVLEVLKKDYPTRLDAISMAEDELKTAEANNR